MVAVGSDFGTSVKVSLLVQPGAAGFNQFSADGDRLRHRRPPDRDERGPSLPARLAYRESVPPRSTCPPPARATTAREGGNLSLDGIWNITATLDGPNGSVEVPLVVATQVAAQPHRHQRCAGNAHDLHVHLPDQSTRSRSTSIQARPAPMRCTSRSSTPRAMSSRSRPPRSRSRRPAQPGSVVIPRLLEPGHFTADLTVAAGGLSIDMIGQAPGGNPLHAHLEVKIEP